MKKYRMAISIRKNRPGTIVFEFEPDREFTVHGESLTRLLERLDWMGYELRDI